MSEERIMSGSDLRSVVNKYLERLDDHDVAGALELLGDDFRLEFAGGGSMQKEGMERVLGWDVGTSGRFEWEVTSRGPEGITVEGEETNEFLRLLGLGPLSFRSRFRVDGEGRIVEQHHEVDWSGAALDEALEPAVAWAEEHAPDELAGLRPEGRIVYSEEMGRRWVTLLRKWKDAKGTSADRGR